MSDTQQPDPIRSLYLEHTGQQPKPAPEKQGQTLRDYINQQSRMLNDLIDRAIPLSKQPNEPPK